MIDFRRGRGHVHRIRELLIAIAALGCVALASLGTARAGTEAPGIAVAHDTAPRDYLAEVRAGFTPENRAYAAIRVRLALIAPFYAIAAALLLLATGLSARMRDIAHARARSRYARALIYSALFIVAMSALSLPFEWYRGFLNEHRFHLSNQSLGAWLGEQGKDAVVNVVVLGGTGLLALAFLAIERSPRRWWLPIGLAALPLLVAGVLLEPIVIDPLYNRFTPLRDQALKARIVALAERAGIPGRRVFEVDRSRQTRKYNAYVNGFGASQRIVLWDTTLKGMTEDEILAVMAHEMGHYRLRHIWKNTVFRALLSLVVLYLLHRLAGAALSLFGARWRITALHDLAALPVFFAGLMLLAVAAQPLACALSRRFEHEADTFSLEATRDNDAAARAFLKLGSQNRADPEPSALVKTLLFTHPPILERVRFAIEYRPWESGAPNRFYHGASR